MAKKALIVLAEGFEDIEAVTCIDVLRRGGVEVTVTGLKDATVRASRGTVVIADKKLDEAGSGFDALVLPGGLPGATNLAASEKLNSLIKAMFQAGKIVAAICASPSVVLAPTGILKHKSVTGFPGMMENFDKSTVYLEDDVVVDGTLITSRGPATALDFALAILEKLEGGQVSGKVRKATLAG